MRELDEVVEKADRPAAERDEEDGERRDLVLREGEKCTRGDDEDQEAAHRRRSLLDAVAFRSLFTNVLTELVPSQERDELRTDNDGHDHGDHRRRKDTNQVVARI